MINNKRRARLEIYVDVLRAINEGRHSPTNIMYAANLSWKPVFEDILPLLVRGELVWESPVDGGIDGRRRQVYQLAPRGAEVLKLYAKLDLLIFGFHPKMKLREVK